MVILVVESGLSILLIKSFTAVVKKKKEGQNHTSVHVYRKRCRPILLCGFYSIIMHALMLHQVNLCKYPRESIRYKGCDYSPSEVPQGSG